MSSITSRDIQSFRRKVWTYYRKAGRHGLPWRQSHDPYKILVSEIMLQQTQVDRVLPKYAAFITTFPNVTALAQAPLGDALRLWQGLGYNRRVKYLHAAAKMIVSDGGVFPATIAQLSRLPGVGVYTAAAVVTFAYEKRMVLIETNIRTVFLHHFFPQKQSVTDMEVLTLVEKTLPRSKFRDWYYALMDYGAHLKKTTGNANVRSRHYTKQTRFKGSDRELRGKILRLVLSKPTSARVILSTLQTDDPVRVRRILETLQKEGLVVRERKSVYRLPI